MAPNHLAIHGNYLYAPSASGLSIYSIPGTSLNSLITGYTAIVQTSNGGTVTYDPSSFNVAPSKITPGGGFDTIEWDNPAVSTLTWNSNVTGIQTGQIATVDQGGSVNFTSTLGNPERQIWELLNIGADQIISLSPATQTLTGGNGYFGGFPGAQFNLTLRNPTSAPVTYNLTFAGIQASWLPTYPEPNFPATATVPAQGTVNLTLNLSPPLTLPSGTLPFEVIVNATGISGSVGGNIVLVNANPQTPNAPGVGALQPVTSSPAAVQATPSSVSVGRGGTAFFTAQLTNVGLNSDTYDFQAAGNPTTGHANIAVGNSTPIYVISPWPDLYGSGVGSGARQRAARTFQCQDIDLWNNHRRLSSNTLASPSTLLTPAWLCR